MELSHRLQNACLFLHLDSGRQSSGRIPSLDVFCSTGVKEMPYEVGSFPIQHELDSN